MCFHKWEGGHGAMGDGYDCLKCGAATYSLFPLTWFYRLFNRIKEQ
jgi:hypothetical protein